MSVQDQIRETALRYGVDPALALAVARQESGFNQGARGTSGEVGIYQLMPGTAAELGVDPYNETQNIEGGIRYLAQQISRFGVELGLVAYNAGPGNVSRGTIPTTSQAYAASVLDQAGLYNLASGAGKPEMQYASLLPDLSSLGQVPAWVWIAGGGLVLFAMLRRG